MVNIGNWNMGITSILTSIYSDYPSITWATPSPHVAIEGVSNELEIKTKSDDHLREILWFFKEKPINKKTEHFDFPGLCTTTFSVIAIHHDCKIVMQ